MRNSLLPHRCRLDELIFHGFNRRVAAVHRTTGEIVWQWKAPKGHGFVALMLEADLLIVSVSGYLYALDPLSGAERWANPMKSMGLGIGSLVSVNAISRDNSGGGAQSQANDQAAAG